MLFGKKIKLTISALALCLAAMPGTHAQMRMTMEDAIATARSQSVEALEARQAFIMAVIQGQPVAVADTLWDIDEL